jgi:hypothetical protein
LLVAGVSHSGRARWLQLPHHRRCIGSIKTIESHNTKAPVLQLFLPLVSQPFTSCTSPTPTCITTRIHPLVTRSPSIDAQPCSFLKSLRRRSSCILHTSARSFDRTSIANCCRKRRARAQESTPSCVYWTLSTSRMEKCCLDPGMLNTSCTTRPSSGGHIRARWYV